MITEMAGRHRTVGSRLFMAYADRAPASHALFRASELAGFGDIGAGPVLDLGCGAGEFARVVCAQRFDCGLDLCRWRVRTAEATGKYRQVCQADARDMPFTDGAFAAIVSISALEHMLEPERVSAEAYRVLRPGGIFAGTLVLRDLHEHLCFPRWLTRLGLPPLASAYRWLQDRLFAHRTLLSEEAWRAHWRDAGFEIAECRRVVSPRVVRLWDMLLPLAFPYWLGRKLGLTLVWHPRWLVRRFEKVLTEELERDHHDGCCLYFVLRKPAGNRALDGHSAGASVPRLRAGWAKATCPEPANA